MFRRWKLPQEATEIDTKELSRLLRRLLDEVDKGNKQQSSADVGCSRACRLLEKV